MPNDLKDISYADIQKILNDYDENKGFRRKAFDAFELDHVKAIKAALETAIKDSRAQIHHSTGKQPQSLEDIAISSTVQRIPTPYSVNTDQNLMKYFMMFYTELTRILDGNPKGKRSVMALNQIKQLIESSKQFHGASFWQAMFPWFNENIKKNETSGILLHLLNQLSAVAGMVKYDKVIKNSFNCDAPSIATLNKLPRAKINYTFAEAIFNICEQEQGDINRADAAIRNYIQETKKLCDAEVICLAFTRGLENPVNPLARVNDVMRFMPILGQINLNDTLARMPPHRMVGLLDDIITICGWPLYDINFPVERVRNHINLVWQGLVNPGLAQLGEQAYMNHLFGLTERMLNPRNLAPQPDLAPQPAAIRDREAQSTHTASVHKTASLSAMRLAAFFKERNMPVDVNGELEELLEELERFKDGLESYSESTDKSKRHVWLVALSAYEAAFSIMNSQFDYKDAKSQVSTKQLLAMAWMAMNCDEIRTFENPNSDTYVVSRDDALERLRNFLYEVRRGYNINAQGVDLGGASLPICTSGTFNHIVASMVSTVRGIEIIKVDKEMASEKLPFYVKEAIKAHFQSLKRITPEEKKAYQELLAKIKKDGSEGIWDKVREKVIHDYREDFSQLYANDLGAVDDIKLEADVDSGGPFVEIDGIIPRIEEAFNQPTPSQEGLFAAPRAPEPTAPSVKPPENK